MKPWLFSRNVDLLVFGGSAIISLGLLIVGEPRGLLHSDTPPWLWLAAVVLIDVAHVWSTGFRVYFDRDELAKHRTLYIGVPIVGYCIGLALYSEGEIVFWRALAYIAVFHFVRQQWGWVARYRSKANETSGKLLDAITIYTATLYPLAHWHLTLPKSFQWFMAGDFFSGFAGSQTALSIDLILRAWFFAVLAIYIVRMRANNPGKHIVVISTAACWYLGIVHFDSDYAFTVTNVIIHGVPYFAIVYQYAQRRKAEAAGIWAPALPLFLGLLWLIGFFEELLWDRAVWHEPEHQMFFGHGWELGGWRTLVVPLLALPQLTHYILDGFVWRRSASR